MPDAEYIKGRVFKNQSAILVARVTGEDGAAINQASISSGVYSIYELDERFPDNREVVTGHDGASLTIADVIFDTLQTDDLWKNDLGNLIDSTGYNYKHVLDVSANQAFPTAGKTYLAIATLTPASGQPIPVEFKLECL